MDNFCTVMDCANAEIEINKSRFIVYVSRAEKEENAIEFIEKIKRMHHDATHNCSAYVVEENDRYQRADDDGEPSGTAGKPILEVIKKSGLRDVVIVVTRYFGGVKLGAGGLIRAYGRAASLGIKSAGIVEKVLHSRIAIKVDYHMIGKVKNELQVNNYKIEEIQFLEKVTIIVLVGSGGEAEIQAKVSEWTAGQAKLIDLGKAYVEIPLN